MQSGLIAGYEHYLKFEKRYSPHTLKSYLKDVADFFQYISVTFSISDPVAVLHFHVRSWLAEELKLKSGLSARSINRKLSSLNSFYKHLLRQGIVTKNPVKLSHAQKVPPRLPVFLKEPETELLIQEADFVEGFKGATDRLVCELLYVTGMRRAELMSLKEKDVEWSLRQIRVLGKGNKERLIPVGDVLLDAIREYIAQKKELENHDDTYLLNLPNGKPINASYVYRSVKSSLSQVTTLSKKSPHVLRHTFATHLLNNGANIQAIKDLLGHSSLAATQVYTHNTIDKLKEIHRLNHPRG